MARGDDAGQAPCPTLSADRPDARAGARLSTTPSLYFRHSRSQVRFARLVRLGVLAWCAGVVPVTVNTSVRLRDSVHRRWRATGQPMALIVEWGIDAYWVALEGEAPDPLRAASDRFAHEVWRLARDGVITGPPEDLPFPER